MSDVVLHINRPKDGRRISESRVAVMSGDVVDITHALIAKIRQSDTCEVALLGGDYTGPDGSAKALWFNVTCTLEGHEPMVWEHMVTLPGETWPIA